MTFSRHFLSGRLPPLRRGRGRQGRARAGRSRSSVHRRFRLREGEPRRRPGEFAGTQYTALGRSIQQTVRSAGGVCVQHHAEDGLILFCGHGELSTEATGRGCLISALQALQRFGIEPSDARVVVQGFGNVGYWASKFFVE